MTHLVDMECRVGHAPIAHERSLLVEGVDGEYQSSADQDQVRLLEGEPDETRRFVKGLVPVLVLDEDRAANRVFVQLPREVFMGGRRVWVPANALRR